jgi:hypothetical protein
MSKRLIVPFLWMLLTLVTVPGQANVIVQNISENFSPTVKVSGLYLHGFQYAGHFQSSELYLFFPAQSTGKLCIALSSYDGKYKAKLEHDITEPQNGWTLIDFMSRYESELEEYAADEIAIHASFEEKCGMRRGGLLAAAWSDPASLEGPLRLLIRSEAKVDTVHIPNQQQPEASFTCEKIDRQNRVSYDKLCVLEGIELSALDQLDVERRYFRPFKTEHIKVAQ